MTVEHPEDRDLIPCPRCAESIQRRASACRFCGQRLHNGEPDSRTRRWILAGALAVLVVGAGVTTLALQLTSGGSEPDTHASATEASGDSQADFQRCVDLWNGDANDTIRNSVSSNSEYNGDGYIQIGSLANYPDRCAILMSFPDQKRTYEYTEQSDPNEYPGPFGLGRGVEPPSDPDWNAELDSDGTLSLE